MSSWVSFITGGMTVLFAYAIFSSGPEEDTEVEIIEPEDTGLVVTGVSGKLFDILCANCRKFKRHREIQPRVFECTRCKRQTNLRIPS